MLFAHVPMLIVNVVHFNIVSRYDAYFDRYCNFSKLSTMYHRHTRGRHIKQWCPYYEQRICKCESQLSIRLEFLKSVKFGLNILQDISQILTELRRLKDENKKLMRRLKDENKKLIDENKQLRKTDQKLIDENKQLKKTDQKLIDENKQLKDKVAEIALDLGVRVVREAATKIKKT